MSQMSNFKIFYGPMFSEKSGDMISEAVKLSLYAKKKVIAFKPCIDTRSDMQIKSRTGVSLPAFSLTTDASELLTEYFEKETLGGVNLSDTDIILFDEIQFYSKEIVILIKKLLRNGYNVMAAGLNLDYRGKPIGSVQELVLFADEVVKKTAYCSVCGAKAHYTQRMVDGKPYIQECDNMVCIGDKESYEPRCLCHFKSPKLNILRKTTE